MALGNGATVRGIILRPSAGAARNANRLPLRGRRPGIVTDDRTGTRPALPVPTLIGYATAEPARQRLIQPMYDAILFDLDGTLVDTESLSIDAGLQAFGEHGHDITRSFLESLIGTDIATSDAAIQAAFPAIDLGAVNLRFGALYQQLVAQGLPLKPGVSVLLPALRQPAAIVTSSGRDSARTKLSIAGIAGHFSHVVTRDDVTAAKPDPEPYLLAARMFGLPPERCLVFEDSEPGAEAAHRAGCVVVQVPDILPSAGRWAHHLAPDLLTGARLAGVL